MSDHSTACGCCSGLPANSRRHFLTLAAIGAGAALLTPAIARPARAAGSIEALLLNCMDYRLVDDVTRYMDGRGLTNQYDQVILAGASLGALTEKAPAWGPTFWEHVQVAIDLHHIKKVMIMDHRDCGAYKVFLGMDLAGDPAKETAVHTEYLQKLGGMVKTKFPQLGVELMLMSLDGSVQQIPSIA